MERFNEKAGARALTAPKPREPSVRPRHRERRTQSPPVLTS